MTNPLWLRLGGATLAGWPPAGVAQGATTAAASSLGMFAIAKVLLALLLVLAAIVGVAWLLRRLTPAQHAGGLMRVLGSIAIGPRERLVLVEIGETWFVLGVGPGLINTVHSLPKQAGAVEVAGTDKSLWLRRMLEKRRP